ncbi:hypothetical protein A1D22_08440 [Pasteurellaceae bacterium LFhippo2]|nr:hypothetical protein [Pasteurellaceae bacterium LFhippo2]
MKTFYRAESLTSVMIALVLFSIIYLSYSQWQSMHNNQRNFLYQQRQALQIAENQMSLKMAKRECEKSFSQNGLRFEIQCQSDVVKVSFPLGEVSIR